MSSYHARAIVQNVTILLLVQKTLRKHLRMSASIQHLIVLCIQNRKTVHEKIPYEIDKNIQKLTQLIFVRSQFMIGHLVITGHTIHMSISNVLSFTIWNISQTTYK